LIFQVLDRDWPEYTFPKGEKGGCQACG